MAEPLSPPIGGDASRAKTLNALDWSFTGIAIIFVCCRLYTRLKIIRSPGWDDVLLTISIILITISVAIITAATARGLGRHAFYLPPDQFTTAVKLIFIAQPFGIMAFCLPKLAVALLIKRLMLPARPGLSFLYFITISLVILSAVVAVLLYVQCSPPEALWNPMISHHCWSPSILSNYTVFVGAYSAFCDICLAIFPITILWNLQIDIKKKISVCCVMGLGIFACICAIFKTTKLNELQDRSDFTWGTVDLLYWTTVESDVIIICACVPTLRPLVLYIGSKDMGNMLPAIISKFSKKTRDSNRTELQQYVDMDKNGLHDGLAQQNFSSPEVYRSMDAAVLRDMV